MAKILLYQRVEGEIHPERRHGGSMEMHPIWVCLKMVFFHKNSHIQTETIVIMEFSKPKFPRNPHILGYPIVDLPMKDHEISHSSVGLPEGSTW